MDSGISATAVGMLDQFNVENNIADNLANLQTPGYKERTAVLQDFSQVLLSNQLDPSLGASSRLVGIGNFSGPPTIRDYGLNLSQGAPRYTGSPHDFMVVGNGFFRVQAGNQALLTRKGTFQRSAAGLLTTSEGYSVLDAAGRPIHVPQGTLGVSHGGELLLNGKPFTRLGLATVPVGTPLKQTGGGYYLGTGTPLAGGAQGVAVLQGYLESSNVDMTTQTTAMIAAQRAYQADAKMMQIQDDTLGLAVNDLGKVS